MANATSTTKTTSTLAIGYQYTHDDTKKIVYLKINEHLKIGTDMTRSEYETAIKDFATSSIAKDRYDESGGLLLDPYGEPFDSATAIVTAYTEDVETISIETGYED